MTIAKISPQTVAADAKAALAIDRARGVPIPHGEDWENAYGIGFAAGALWLLDKLKEEKEWRGVDGGMS